MVASYETKTAVKQILLDMAPYLDEKQKRILYGSAAAALGHGGISFVNEVTGSARNTITSGMEEISSMDEGQNPQPSEISRIRKPGAGRKTALEKNPLLYEKIEEIITETPMESLKSRSDGLHGACVKFPESLSNSASMSVRILFQGRLKLLVIANSRTRKCIRSASSILTGMPSSGLSTKHRKSSWIEENRLFL